MFDTALIESGSIPRPGGRRGGLPLAISVHAAAIAAIVTSSVWRPGEPAEPELRIAVAFPETPRPSPPGGNGARLVRSVSPRRGVAALPRRIPVPSRIAEIEPRTGDERSGSPSALEGPDTGSSTPENGGDLGGDPGLGPEGGGAGARDPIPVAGDVREPRLVFQVEPDYPETMRRSRVEGVVVAEAVITAGGDVQSVRIVKSVNPIIDRAVIEAVRRWRYRAATLDGRPVAVYLTVTVRFGFR